VQAHCRLQTNETVMSTAPWRLCDDDQWGYLFIFIPFPDITDWQIGNIGLLAESTEVIPRSHRFAKKKYHPSNSI